MIDLLAPDEVARLASHYDSLDHEDRTEWPFVDGFHTSLYDQRRSYRESVLSAYEDVMGPALDRVFDAHRIMFANYTVKLPGADEVPLHVDWTFLDEADFRSATVWCPLIDVDSDVGNGPLGVVVGSHRRIDFVRIVNVPCYDRSVALTEDLERITLDLRPGQAVVMDNRTVHFSQPNHTDAARIVASCVIGPSEATMHHYWQSPDDGRLFRFALDREFYLTYSVGDPWSAEGVVRVDEVPAGVG